MQVRSYRTARHLVQRMAGTEAALQSRRSDETSAYARCETAAVGCWVWSWLFWALRPGRDGVGMGGGRFDDLLPVRYVGQ
jgi:hypothetical protein